MALAHKSPGVEREDVFLKPQARLETGIPGFVGFAEPKVRPDVKSRKPKRGVPFALHRKIELADDFSCPTGGFLADAIGAFFDNGGERCYVVALGAAKRDAKRNAEALEAGIDALARVGDLDLIVVPDATALPIDEALQVQRHAVEHCAAQGDRLAILDVMRGSGVDAPVKQRDAILLGQAEPVNTTLYYPWLRLMPLEGKLGPPWCAAVTGPCEDTEAQEAREKGTWLVPPSGAVAGVYARTDARTGVHKAPANEELTGVSDLEIDVDTAIQDLLNPEGINCLRAFPGRGIRVWGARTISRDPSWRYVTVRRLVLTLRRWILLNMAWTGFEPNGPRLWIRIERELREYLTGLWRTGALTGDMPDAAFYVKCDIETNPLELRDLGEVVTEIGLAPNPPAEFVVIRVTQREGVADLLPR
jgi:hypothetical protein